MTSATRLPGGSPSHRAMLRLTLALVVVIWIGSAVTAQADPSVGRNIALPTDPVFQALPGSDNADILRLWQEGSQLEAQEDYLASNARYQQIAERLSASPYPHWRMARNYWHHTKTFPKEDQDDQVRYLELADQAADRGLKLDDECAECMLWKYATLGRLTTVRGLLSGGPDAKTMAGLIERGIEIASKDSSPSSQATLANFYYASASFYRMVPDWFWLRWVFGVQGSKERAIGDARKAVALADGRLDYQVELGAALLCFGTAKDHGESIDEGVILLQRVQGLSPKLPTDANDQELAHVLLQKPGRACEFSRAGFLDISSVAAGERD